MSVQPPRRQRMNFTSESNLRDHNTAGVCSDTTNNNLDDYLQQCSSEEPPQNSYNEPPDCVSSEFGFSIVLAQDESCELPPQDGQYTNLDLTDVIDLSQYETTEADIDSEDFLVLEDQSGKVVFSGNMFDQESTQFFPTSDTSDEESGTSSSHSITDNRTSEDGNNVNYFLSDIDARDDLVLRKRIKNGLITTKREISRFSVEIGAGLQNLSNTCFINATLQCLTYTTPLLRYLLDYNCTEHSKYRIVRFYIVSAMSA